jgi:hypothetical protein
MMNNRSTVTSCHRLGAARSIAHADAGVCDPAEG